MNAIDTKHSSKVIPDNLKKKSYDNMKSLLSDDGLLEIEEHNGQLTIFISNRPYAAMKLDGDELVVQFIQPHDLTGLDKKLSYYSELKNPTGWLEFRTYADNNYDDQFQAELGSFIGQILSELNMKK